MSPNLFHQNFDFGCRIDKFFKFKIVARNVCCFSRCHVVTHCGVCGFQAIHIIFVLRYFVRIGMTNLGRFTTLMNLRLFFTFFNLLLNIAMTRKQDMDFLFKMKTMLH